MSQEELIELLTQKALGYLSYDDANPEVGMGMNIGTAVDLAKRDVKAESNRWDSRISTSYLNSLDNTVIERVRTTRRNRF